MWLELPPLWIVVLNLVAIPAIHLGISWGCTRLAPEAFPPESWLFRERPWERGGQVYQRLFRIRHWKSFLPDAAPWFDGFAKAHLRGKDAAYLRTFLVETCRGEAAHWAQVLGLLVTLLWNPWPIAAGVMIASALLSNLPCLLLQRYTRARLRRLLGTKERPKGGPDSKRVPDAPKA